MIGLQLAALWESMDPDAHVRAERLCALLGEGHPAVASYRALQVASVPAMDAWAAAAAHPPPIPALLEQSLTYAHSRRVLCAMGV